MLHFGPVPLYLIEILHQTTTLYHRFLKSSTLYLIEILHQTTTITAQRQWKYQLYLIEILHQTTTHLPGLFDGVRCILLKFYIKPQRRAHYLLKFSALQSFLS